MIAETGRLLQDIGVDVLVVDEAQHLLRGRKRDIESVLNLIRLLVDRRICQVVLAGMPILRRLVRRLRYVPMRHLNLENFIELEPTKFQTLLEQLSATLGIPCEIKPSDQLLIESVRQTGAVGSVITFFKTAAIHAIASGSQYMSTDDFVAAFNDFRALDHIPAQVAGDRCQSVSLPAFQGLLPQAEPHAPQPLQLRTRRGHWWRPPQSRVLPICIEPRKGESFRSFLMRLAAANHYTNMVQFIDSIDFAYSPFIMTRRSLEVLSIAADIPVQRLAYLAHIRAPVRGHGTPCIFQGRVIPRNAIDDHLGVCPLCLADGNHRRAIWDLRGIGVCLKHKTLLVDSCPNCGEPWNFWALPFGICHWEVLGRPCGTRIREIEPISANSKELNDAWQLMKWFRDQPSADLPQPYHVDVGHLPPIAKQWTRQARTSRDGQYPEIDARP